MDQFRNLVVRAGEVGTRGINNRIQNAEALAFLSVRNKIVGIAALKNPSTGHKREVFEKANAVDSLPAYRFELGWCHVSKKFQGNGYSKVLLKELLPSARGQGVYATSRLDNQRMHKSLENEGFVQIGDSWPSTNQPGKSLFLFVRD
jgi:GNAT superfamily N-acetyltransferase